MAKRRRFRKVYFICENNNAIPPQLLTVTCYRDLKYAQGVFETQKKLEVNTYIWLKEPPKKHIEGFYLVHESLFDEVLKKWCENG